MNYSPPVSGSDMSMAPKARACAWWNGRSISAPTASSWSRWPATPREIFDETRSFDYYLGGTFAALASCCC